MQIRPMRQSDAKVAYQIEKATQVAPWSKFIFSECVRVKHLCFVAVDNVDAVSGFIIVQRAVDECHILNLGVHPAKQGQGIGKSLVQYALDLKQQYGFNHYYLEVRESNTIAISLYKKLGFNEMDTRKDYYPTPTGRENAIIMGLDI